MSLQIRRKPDGAIINFTMPRPSNFHRHFRWDQMVEAVAPELMYFFMYVLGMPNNGPGEGGVIRTIEEATRVYHKLMDIRAKHGITTLVGILMTLYHTKDINASVVERVARSHIVRGIKNYPGHGGTTNSGHGVPFDEDDETAHACVVNDVRRLYHAEDLVDLNGNPLPHALREGHCITHRMWKHRDKHPGLICVEHASTREAIDFVKADTSGRTVMTVTPQHLLFTAEDFDKYSWRNHLRCMPYVKTEDDRQALLEFVTSGDPRCIAGDDSAPHPLKAKDKPFEEAACGCWLPHSVALYAIAFMQKDALDDRFVKFMCYNGPDWWGLPRPAAGNTLTVWATDKDIPDPTPLPELNDVVIPLGWTEEPDRLRIGYAASMKASEVF